MARRRRNQGFTIIELLTVVAIMGVLMALAFPAFGELIKNSRRTTVVNEVSASLQLARAEAAKRGQPVTVCGLTSGGGNSCTGGTIWDYGWLVFVDVNGNGFIENAVTVNGVDYDEATMVLRKVLNDHASEVRVRSAITLSNGNAGTGHATLRPFNQSGDNGQGTINICDKRGAAKARQLALERNGRASVRINSTEDTSTGVAITCPA
jgi:prepilin-type N-terminal cleavage/methylation domain-containing protein